MSETKQYQWNETVDIAIRGARVDHHADGELWIQVPGAKAGSLIPLTDAVSVERVAPADGPVQFGDIWSDRHGTRWFARFYEPEWADDDKDPMKELPTNDEGSVLVLSCGSGGPCGTSDKAPAEVSRRWGPLTLVYREPAPQRESAAPVFEPGELDGIAVGTPTPVVDPLAAASQQLHETTNGEEFTQAFGGFMSALGQAADHEQGFHDDCDPARCADAERAVAELHGEVSA